jgi:hypothetical protein
MWQLRSNGLMPNPLVVAVKGKGFLPMLARGQAITGHYGLTSAKIDHALAQLADTLKPFAGRATIPVTAVALSGRSAVARKYQAQGLELAIHGLRHVDYTQLALDEQLDHLRRAQRLFEQAGVRAAGFRCPYLRWNANTIAALSECGFAYDSSQALAWDVTDDLETDAYRRVLDFYGAQLASEYPALPRLTNDIVRIPYCLPDDEALVERLRLTDGQAMAEIWLAMLDRIYQAGELLTLGLHPERVSLCREALLAVLEKARSLAPAVWIASLSEIDAWYRALGKATSEVCQETSDCYRIAVHAPPQATILVRSLEVEISAEPWARGYRSIPANEFTCRSIRRPLVGLSPDSSPSLRDFLRHQGYLIEISADARAFSFYIRRARFGPEDERPLLAELDQGDWAVVRLARWPGGAQCGLAVTGDVDAFTLWDYGRRLLNR